MNNGIYLVTRYWSLVTNISVAVIVIEKSSVDLFSCWLSSHQAVNLKAKGSSTVNFLLHSIVVF